MPLVRLVLASMLLVGASHVLAQEAERPAFSVWLEGVRAEAVSRGISAAVVQQAFDGLEPLEVVVERDRAQTEAVLTVEEYVRRRLTARVIGSARDHFTENRTLLKRVQNRYRVQGRFLVAVWGLESNFGRFSGTRPVVQALATLAWEGRRGAFFKGELMDALTIVERGDISLPTMKGSWAGAMGQVQFMPSSYLKHAQDFDEDGRQDIWSSTPDVLASIANYLKDAGWHGDETWGRSVRVPAGGADELAAAVGLRESGCRAEREMTRPLPLAKWQALGVRASNGRALPKVDRDASLVRAGRANYLVYPNYDALLAYNCAHAYALAVGRLADRLP
jgi:membrane-bound lytic murein transglycosylase B